MNATMPSVTDATTSHRRLARADRAGSPSVSGSARRVAEYTCRHSGNGRARRDILRHDRAGADERTLANRDAAHDHGAAPDRRPSTDARRHDLPVGLGLERAAGGRARIAIVDEHHAVTDEDLVLDRHPLAQERMRGDLAPGADAHALLNLDERTDLRLVADLA